jgi:hypothetical protein
MSRLSETEACGFEDLFADVQSRAGMIVTFLAMLEMIRLKLIRVFQSGAMGPIRVYKRARPADAPKPLGDRGAIESSAHRPIESSEQGSSEHRSIETPVDESGAGDPNAPEPVGTVRGDDHDR